ncbi:MAG: hypothetical protein CMJ28_06360 [Phycisphaerae bacterium]|nr:hypothetical protein [Phycisphaerae bacterium]
MQFFTLVMLHAAKLTQPPVIPGVLDVADFGPRVRQIRVESIQTSGLQTIEGVLPWGQIDPSDAWILAKPLLETKPPRSSLDFAQSILAWSDRWEGSAEVADRAIRLATVRDPSLRSTLNDLKFGADRTRLRLRTGDAAARLGDKPSWPEIPAWPQTKWQAGFGMGPEQDASFERLCVQLGQTDGLTLETAPSDLLRSIDLALAPFGVERPLSTTRLLVARSQTEAAYRDAAQQLGRAPEPEGSWTPSGRHVVVLLPPQTKPPTAEEQSVLVRLLVAARQHQDESPRQAVRWWYAGMREVVVSALTGRSRIDGPSRTHAVQSLRDEGRPIQLAAPWSKQPGPLTWQEDAAFGLLVEMLVTLNRDLSELHSRSKTSDTKAMLAFLGGDQAGFLRGAARYWRVHE